MGITSLQNNETCKLSHFSNQIDNDISEINNNDFPLYYVICPQGTEDVVMWELDHLPSSVNIIWKSLLPSKQLLTGLISSNNKIKDIQIEETSQNSLRGVLFFTLSTLNNTKIPALIKETEEFLDSVRRIRSVEIVLLHLFSCPCTDNLNNIDKYLIKEKDKIHKSIIKHLSELRNAANLRLHKLKGYNGPWFSTGITDSNIVFRVNCERRDNGNTPLFTSQQIAVYLGELLYENFNSLGWEVNMLYFNVEFFALHDSHHIHFGVVLNPPALPRNGQIIQYTEQLGLEILRQHIGNFIIQEGESVKSKFKSIIPRPGAVRHELRKEKSFNSMNPSLANVLCHYANIHPYMTVVDPFIGSGTLLIEAWSVINFNSLITIGGDMYASDTILAWRNLQSEILFLALVNGLLPDNFLSYNNEDEISNLCFNLLNKIKKQVEIIMHSPHEILKNNTLKFDSLEINNIVEKIQEILSKKYKLIPDIFHWDAEHIPLKSNSVDRIISDLPFGRRCGSHKINLKLYPMMLRECYRILRNNCHTTCTTSKVYSQKSYVKDLNNKNHKNYWWIPKSENCNGRAVLLTIEGKLMMRTLEEIRKECPFRLLHEPFTVDMGGLSPYVFVLEKENLNV